MIWLFIQTWFWLLLAALLGLLVGWWIWGRSDDNSAELASLRKQLEDCRRAAADASASGAGSAASGGAQAAVSDTAAAVAEISDDWKPVGLDAPDGEADDLKRISGVGPVIEKTLNGLGIYHFRQVAAFTPDNVKWVDNFIDFPGRIDREGWVDQAARLDSGQSTDFSSRYDKGETS
ncbi:MAG: hypothetical protein AAF402_10120 [Pseudomonadota bacterium]